MAAFSMIGLHISLAGEAGVKADDVARRWLSALRAVSPQEQVAQVAALIAARTNMTTPLPRRLLRKAPADPVPMYSHATSVLALALRESSPEAVERLLDANATLTPDERDRGLCELTWVVKAHRQKDETLGEYHRRQEAVLDLLSQRGHRWDAPHVTAFARDMALIYLVGHNGSRALVPQLVALGANPWGATKNGRNALHMAIGQVGTFDLIEPLIDVGLDPEASVRGKPSPLDLARQRRDTFIGKACVLLERAMLSRAQISFEHAPTDPSERPRL